MKTLEQIKDEIAKHLSDKSWVQLMSYDYEYCLGISKIYSVEDLMDMVAKRYAVNVAVQVLEDAANKIKLGDTISNITKQILQTEIKLP